MLKGKDHRTSSSSVWLLAQVDGVQFKFHGLPLLEKISLLVMSSIPFINGSKDQPTVIHWPSKLLSTCHLLTIKLPHLFLVSPPQQGNSKSLSTKRTTINTQENWPLFFIVMLFPNQLQLPFLISSTLRFTLFLNSPMKWDPEEIQEPIKFQVPLVLVMLLNTTNSELEIDFWHVLETNVQILAF